MACDNFANKQSSTVWKGSICKHCQERFDKHAKPEAGNTTAAPAVKKTSEPDAIDVLIVGGMFAPLPLPPTHFC
jgi:hypothetical protein